MARLNCARACTGLDREGCAPPDPECMARYLGAGDAGAPAPGSRNDASEEAVRAIRARLRELEAGVTTCGPVNGPYGVELTIMPDGTVSRVHFSDPAMNYVPPEGIRCARAVIREFRFPPFEGRPYEASGYLRLPGVVPSAAPSAPAPPIVTR